MTLPRSTGLVFCALLFTSLSVAALETTDLTPGDSYAEGFGRPDTGLYAQSFVPVGNRLDEIDVLIRHAVGGDLEFRALITGARLDNGGGMNMAPDMNNILFTSEPLAIGVMDPNPSILRIWPSIPMTAGQTYFVVLDAFTGAGPVAGADIGAWSDDLYLDGEFVYLNSGDLALQQLTDANNYEWERWFYTADLAVKLIYDQPPFVRDIMRTLANPTNAGSVNFRVRFTHGVTGVDVSDFALTTSGVNGASPASLTPVNASTYTVHVNTGTGDGTIRLDLHDDDSIKDNTDLVLNDVGVGNGDFTTGQVYTIDKTPPSLSIGSPSRNPTRYLPVSFTVTYSGADSVTLAASKVNVLRSGSATATPVVTGTGVTTRTVTLTNIRGEGTLAIQIASQTAQDLAGNLAAATGASTAVQVLLANQVDSDQDGIIDMVEDADANGIWSHADYVFPMRWPYPGNETDLGSWDTDDDGISDGIEVALSTNPLDANSPAHAPGESGVPALSWLGMALLGASLAWGGRAMVRRRIRQDYSTPEMTSPNERPKCVGTCFTCIPDCPVHRQDSDEPSELSTSGQREKPSTKRRANSAAPSAKPQSTKRKHG